MRQQRGLYSVVCVIDSYVLRISGILIDALAKKSEQAPKGQWIVGRGYGAMLPEVKCWGSHGVSRPTSVFV